MKYYMPTKLYSGPDCVKEHADELSSYGKHALIVTGKGSARKNHSLKDVTDALDSRGISYTIFEGVEENPSVETVMKATVVGLDSKADHVIGIGGGSALDAAKAVALMMNNPERSWEFLYENTNAKALQVVAVPTTCGTGSEVTGVSVLTRHDLKTKISMKHKVFPNLALIDGKYILSAPRSLIINTAIDAFAHLVESAVNSNADYYSLLNVIGGISLWRSCRAYIDEKDTNASKLDEASAQRLMEASAIAGISIAQTGTSLPHALSYMLTYESGIPHGPACGMFLARYLELADDKIKNDILTAAGFESCEEMGSFIERLAPVAVDKEILRRSAMSVLSNTGKLKNCPYQVDEKTMDFIAGV
ncbi:MAG: iron-containing alcohol dehydrogenase [Lachnospiraceae bacterium]|nr:iron-containing alcohol dehydrogenase [Lachnospiraceae bacterium]